MNVGFTGSRSGATDQQLDAIVAWFLSHTPERETVFFHQGCCVGSDAQATKRLQWLRLIGKRSLFITGYPCNLKDFVDLECCDCCDVLYEPDEPLKRNKRIVDSCDVILATPEGSEKMRSGTWSTIRHAITTKKPVVIFLPDGTVEKR